MLKGKLEIVRFEFASNDRQMVQLYCHTADSSILPVRHNERRVIQFSYGMNTVRVACRRLKILKHVEKSCS